MWGILTTSSSSSEVQTDEQQRCEQQIKREAQRVKETDPAKGEQKTRRRKNSGHAHLSCFEAILGKHCLVQGHQSTLTGGRAGPRFQVQNLKISLDTLKQSESHLQAKPTF